MKNRFQFLVLLFLFIFTTSCTPIMSDPSPEVSMATSTPAPTPLPSPEAGKASLTGRIISNKTQEPLRNTFVRLAEVVRQGDEGAYVLDVAFSPGATSDENGDFVFENIEAKEYVIVIGDVYDKFEVVPGEDGTAKVWEALVDKVVNVGSIYVETLP